MFNRSNENTKSSFDPTVLQDEFAMSVEWEPAKPGGTNIATHQLVEVSGDRVEFKVFKLALILPWLFISMGALGVIGSCVGGYLKNPYAYLGVPFFLLFLGAGIFVYRSWSTPCIFDRSLGYYWRGSPLANPNDIQQFKKFCDLKHVRAIQLVREFCNPPATGSGASAYYSYEINLVLQDKSRVNVVDHGNLVLAQKDAKTLADFLNVVLWDATAILS